MKRMVLQTIILHRQVKGGKEGEMQRVVPEIGKAFDFTADELREIKAVAPDAYRKLRDESDDGDDGDDKSAGESQGKGSDGKAQPTTGGTDKPKPPTDKDGKTEKAADGL